MLIETLGETWDGPGQEFGDAVHGMVGDDAEHVAQVGFGVDPVQLGAFDQRGDAGGPGAARVRAVFIMLWSLLLRMIGTGVMRPLALGARAASPTGCALSGSGRRRTPSCARAPKPS